ncbi:MAG: hypothetical protein ACPGSN_10200, partial [Psychrobium sp.]
MIPHNKKVTDEQIIEACSKHDNLRDAAASLNIAYQTLKNRRHLINTKAPKSDLPNSYQHTKSKKYFITCAVSDAPLDKNLYNSIQHLDAQLIVIPVKYQWNKSKLIESHTATYPKQLSDYMLSEDIQLNKHLMLMGSVPLHATLQNPLTGIKHVSHNKSAIYGHPQLAFESVATAKNDLPKLLYTTGAITLPRYTTSKEGRKARDLHGLGGLLVEVSNDRFHIFEIRATEDGSFYHLNKYYTPKKVVEIDSIPAIYMADEHVEFYPEDVKQATYGKGGLCDYLNPEQVVRGDVYNHGSDSHHGRTNVFERVVRQLEGRNSVIEELDQSLDFINETTTNFHNVIVASNHHDHLKKWLMEANQHQIAAHNIWAWHQLNADMYSEAMKGEYSVDPYELYCRKYHKETYSKCTFLGRDAEYKICGVEVSLHGDVGANGARGNVQNLSLGGQELIIGHGHSPRRYRNVLQVGASAMNMWYNKGFSGWMATHGLIYPNGMTAAVHII